LKLLYEAAREPSVLGTTSSISPENQASRIERYFPRTGRLCHCSERKTSTRRHWKYGTWTVFHDTVREEQHSPNCKYSRIIPPNGSSSLGLTFTGLRHLTSHALTLSFSLKHGAGGTSLSPDLTCYRVVDRAASPAFELMSHVIYGAYKLGYDSNKAGLGKELLDKGFRALETLFRDGKASPNDLTVDGRSLLHNLFSTVSWPSKII
jgi:hypothetical protein